MNWQPEEENRIRRFLLHDTTPEETQQVEEKLLRDDEFAERLLLIEDELIDDYARGTLPEAELRLFERGFALTPPRRQKLIIAQELVRYATRRELEAAGVAPPAEEGAAVRANDQGAPPPRAYEQRVGTVRPANHWWRALFVPGGKIAIYALLIVGLGLGVWWFRRGAAEVEKGLALLNRAYHQQRLVEARITKLGHAPFYVTLGETGERTDERARNLAEKQLLEAVENTDSAAAYHALGRAYLAKKEFDQAIRQFEVALKKSDRDEAQLHSDLGAALLEKGKLESTDEQSGKGTLTLAKSLEHLNRALALNGSLLEARFNRALLYQALKLPQQARADWEKYLEADRTSPWAAEAQQNLELLDKLKKNTAQTRERRYQDFIRAYQEGDEARAWQALCASHFRSGNYIAAQLIDAFLAAQLKHQGAQAGAALRALSYAGTLAERRAGEHFLSAQAEFYRAVAPTQYESLTQAHTLMKAVDELYQHTESDRALEHCTRARQLFAQAGAEAEVLCADFWIGVCHYLNNDPQQSRQVFARVAQEGVARGYLWLPSAAFNGLALTSSVAADYSLGIGYCQHARQLAAQLGDVNGELRSVVMLAGFYQNVGKYDECLRAAERGLELAEQLAADDSQVSGLYAHAAQSLSALKLYDAALAYQQAAVSLARAIDNPLAISRYLIHLGQLYGKLKNYAAAISSIEQGLACGEKLNAAATGQEMVGYALLNLGHVQREAGDFTAAVAAFNRVIAFSQERGPLLLLHWAHKGRLLTYIKQQNISAARGELQEVLGWLEAYREKILEESNRNSFFDTEQDFYDVAIDFALTAERDPRRAFEYAERCRARSLRDANQGGKQVIGAAPATDLRLTPAAPPLTLAALQKQMPERAQFLQYAVLEDKLIIWLLTRSGFESRTVGVKADELARLVTDYLEQISKPPADQVTTSGPAAQLYELLLRPVASLLDRDKLLCIAPDKMLNFLPFGALSVPETGKYLLETYALCYAPSANLFLRASAAARQKADGRAERLLSVGNPRFDRRQYPDLADLPWAAHEAKAIAELYDDYCLLLEGQAKKEAVLKELDQADVVHLALHHLPDQRYPMRSKLILAATQTGTLAEQDLLSAYEIYQQQLARPRLVVLSACQTRASTYYGGEGMIGFSRPFEMADIPLIVASLWPVDSRATTQLMIHFHQARKRAGLSTAAALRAAQAAMINDPEGRYHHPYYWASFVLVGGYSEF